MNINYSGLLRQSSS